MVKNEIMQELHCYNNLKIANSVGNSYILLFNCSCVNIEQDVHVLLHQHVVIDL